LSPTLATMDIGVCRIFTKTFSWLCIRFRTFLCFCVLVYIHDDGMNTPAMPTLQTQQAFTNYLNRNNC